MLFRNFSGGLLFLRPVREKFAAGELCGFSREGCREIAGLEGTEGRCELILLREIKRVLLDS